MITLQYCKFSNRKGDGIFYSILFGFFLKIILGVKEVFIFFLIDDFLIFDSIVFIRIIGFNLNNRIRIQNLIFVAIELIFHYLDQYF